MTLGEDELLDIVELFEQLRGASWTKVTGAGSTVAVSLASDHRRGIMFADVPWRGNRINRIRYFPPPGESRSGILRCRPTLDCLAALATVAGRVLWHPNAPSR